MRFTLAATLLVTAASTGAAFTPSLGSTSARWPSQRVGNRCSTTVVVQSTVEVLVEGLSEKVPIEIVMHQEQDELVGSLTEQLFNARLERQLEKLRLKDQTSKQLTKEVGSTYFPFFGIRRQRLSRDVASMEFPIYLISAHVFHDCSLLHLGIAFNFHESFLCCRIWSSSMKIRIF
jgi:hypothetical protein